MPKFSFKLNYDKNVENVEVEKNEEIKQEAQEGEEPDKLVNFYSETTYFVAPFFVISIETQRVCSLKISLESLIE